MCIQHSSCSPAPMKVMNRKKPLNVALRKRNTAVKNKCKIHADQKGVKGVKSMLTFGRRHRPSKIVVLLHGLDDSAADCATGVVESWAKGLPGALIAVPQSSDQTSWSSNDEPGYDWVPTKRMPPWDAFQKYGPKSKEYKSSLREYRRVLRARCRDLNLWLDALLRKHHLSNSDLVLVGFSLGAYLSSIVGAQRKVRGVIVCGGMCAIRELRFAELMPKRTCSQFLAVNGTRDSLVHRPSLEEALSRYDCKWHWSKGVGHDFPSSWYKAQLRWMQTLFHVMSSGW